MEILLAGIAVGFVVLYVVLAMMMVHHVSKRGVKINIPFIRLFIFKYISQYRQLTRAETGKVGPLFLPCILSINMALILAVFAALI